MSFKYLRALPTPEEIKQQLPLSPELIAKKQPGTKRFPILSPEKTSGFYWLSDLVPPTTKILLLIM